MTFTRTTLFAALLSAQTLVAQFSQQGSKLVGSGAAGSIYQGSVSVSADGNTVIVGGALDGGGVGAAWVYTRSGDAWTQAGAKLVGTGAIGSASQGYSVALSGDGNTAIVGGYADNGGAGAAWVYTRSGGVWTQQGPKLVGTGAVGSALQGIAVTLSADGNTAMVGGDRDDGNVGAAWVFTRSGGVFSQQGTKLVGTGAVGTANQGTSVSLSGDGNTAIVGGDTDDGSVGAAWVFTRSGGVWTQAGAKLVGTGAVGSAYEGFSVALSADGNTAVVGGRADDGDAGAAWVFTRSGGVFSQQGTKLVGTGAIGSAHQGYSVSLSADGSAAIVGGSADDASAGAAWIFTRSGDTWTQEGTKLVGTGAAGVAHQGYSVSLSAEGNTAIVGGCNDASLTGAAWVFTRGTGAWEQQGTKLVGTDATGSANQGISVSVSGDGNTAIISGIRDNGTAGAAWVFTRAGGVFSQQGTKLVGTGAVGPAQQGISVSLSADGNTAIVGGDQDDGAVGAAWVFTRSGDAWTQLGTKLVGTGALGPARQGYSVSLSGDGNTAIVGGYADSGGAGAAWVFTRSGGVFSQEGTKLVGTGAGGSAQQGRSVSLSADGNTAIVGGYFDSGGAGAAWVYARNGGIWTPLGTKLVGGGAVGSARQGYSVSLSGDGNTAMVGGSYDSGNAGAAWVFTRSGGVFSMQGTKLVGTGAVGTANQGRSVSLSADGNTAVVGGHADDGNAGAAWVFTRSGGVWTQEGSKFVGTGAVSPAQQGVSVALSADRSTAIVGGPLDVGGLVGAAWVFVNLLGSVGGGGAVCAGQSLAIHVALTGTPPWTVVWSDGVVQSGIVASPATRVVAPSSTTTYSVTAVTDARGNGFASGSAPVVVNPVPSAPSASSNGPICAGGTLNLSTPSVSGATYWWTGPNGFVSASQNPSIGSAPTAATGTYAVTVTVLGCPSAPGTTDAVVNADSAPPVVTAPGPIAVDQTACCGTSGGATPAGSLALALFAAFGGSATDDCDPNPTRLGSQVGGIDVTSATCFEAGANAVAFRYQDSSGKTGTASASATVRMYGDVNLDGAIDPSDMVILRAYLNFAIAPGTPPFSAPLGMADLTHEGAVDPSDLVVMRAYFNFAVGCLAP